MQLSTKDQLVLSKKQVKIRLVPMGEQEVAWQEMHLWVKTFTDSTTMLSQLKSLK